MTFPAWKNGVVGGFQVAEDCDFFGNDLYNVTGTSPDDCQTECRSSTLCNHFAFNTYSGEPLCWIKKKDGLTKNFAHKFPPNFDAVCGLDCEKLYCEKISGINL